MIELQIKDLTTNEILAAGTIDELVSMYEDEDEVLDAIENVQTSKQSIKIYGFVGSVYEVSIVCNTTVNEIEKTLSNLFTTANSWEASKHSLELDNSEVLYEAIYSAKINDAKVIIVLNTFVDYRFVHVSISGRNFVTKYLRFDLSARDTFASMLTAKALHILNEINELQSRESVIPK